MHNLNSNIVDVEFLLEHLINQEMINQDLDPLNSNDVKEFWRRKGIEV